MNGFQGRPSKFLKTTSCDIKFVHFPPMMERWRIQNGKNTLFVKHVHPKRKLSDPTAIVTFRGKSILNDSGFDIFANVNAMTWELEILFLISSKGILKRLILSNFWAFEVFNVFLYFNKNIIKSIHVGWGSWTQAVVTSTQFVNLYFLFIWKYMVGLLRYANFVIFLLEVLTL